MCKVYFLVFVMALSGRTAFGQAEVEARTNVILPDGRRNLVVANHSNKTITAFAYHVTFLVGSDPERAWDEFQDNVLLPGERAVLPGEVLSMPAGIQFHSALEQKKTIVSTADFRAAVFDDGSAFGDPAWVARIRDRRLLVIQMLDAQIAALRAASAKVAGGGVTIDALADQFRTDEAARMKGYSDRDRQQLVRMCYDSALTNLDKDIPDRPVAERLERVRRAIQISRDRIAKGAGISPGAPENESAPPARRQ
jgi:hypothetical protein